MSNPEYDRTKSESTGIGRRSAIQLVGGAVVGAGLASGITSAQQGGDDDANDLFIAAASGEQQPEGVDTEATGGAIFSRSEDGSEVEYALLVSDIENVTMAHIHLGEPGVDGPIAVWLYPGPDAEEPELQEGRFDGVLATDTFTEEHLTEEVEEETLDALVQEMIDGNTYVNVHTEANPGGEIRGQIMTVDEALDALSGAGEDGEDGGTEGNETDGGS